jgi:hypothetical protein
LSAPRFGYDSTVHIGIGTVIVILIVLLIVLAAR